MLFLMNWYWCICVWWFAIELVESACFILSFYPSLPPSNWTKNFHKISAKLLSVYLPFCFTNNRNDFCTGIVSNANQYPVVKEAVRQMIGTGPMCRYAIDLLPMLKVMTKDCKADLKLDEPVSNFFFFLSS